MTWRGHLSLARCGGGQDAWLGSRVRLIFLNGLIFIVMQITHTPTCFCVNVVLDDGLQKSLSLKQEP